jgi:hypothetical protein
LTLWTLNIFISSRVLFGWLQGSHRRKSGSVTEVFKES